MAQTLRVPPQALDSEEHVLGALLSDWAGPLHDKACEEAFALLRPDHFYRESHGRIFSALRSLHSRGEPMEPVFATVELDQQGLLGDVGGQMRLFELARMHYTLTNVGWHARLVIDAWGKRQCIRAFTRPMTGAWNGSRAPQVLKEVEDALQELRSQVEEDGQTNVISGFRAAEALEEHFRHPPEVGEGIATPFSFLPRLRHGRLYVLGGYTSDGKTSLALQFLRSALNDGKRVGIVTIEMSWEDVCQRYITAYGVPARMVESGRVAQGYLGVLHHALGELARANLDVIDDAGANAAGISRYQRVGRYDLLIVDHLHQIAYKDRQELEQQVRQITSIARRERIPIVLTAQLKRPLNTDGFPRPTMHMFRETGVVEQIASACWAIWRKRDPQTGEQLDDAEWLVMKDRFGPTFTKPLMFRRHEVRYVEVAAE